MFYRLIEEKKHEWLLSEACQIRSVVDYIKKEGKLRDAQIEAIETYLFLKIAGEDKPLWQLFAEGFFNKVDDLSKLHISQDARQTIETNKAARALFEFSRLKNGSTSTLLPELENLILNTPESLDYQGIIKQIFYGVDYTDYLFSLPMGAGKTFLMAALIYLDLYFAQNEPDNKSFAHNFIILIPSGLKSSIIPSLKTIEHFDPTWVLPEPAASDIKKLIKFEVLDQPKSAKKSNRARNPNAQKISQYQPFEELMGLVMVVNAEKVILDRLDLSDQLELIVHSDDERDRQANELRNLIGKIPNLSIHIDEVHHAATDDIKLRQVVTKWNESGTVTGVIGYSGTPYLSSPDKIPLDEKVSLKFTQITNTVEYYPLTRAIQTFLKKPRVEVAEGLEPLKIIEKGVKDFYKNYVKIEYENGTKAKLVIYCGSISRLEEEIFPFVAHLVTKLGGITDDILKYHKGNKQFKLPKENELEFASLDLPVSRKRIVLLVQVGKEGWDCRSLTGVILAQKGDSPTNMVLQTSCRCLRQVGKGKLETALIWLNEFNAKTLNKQLKDEQHTSIEEINRLGKVTDVDLTERFARVEYLKLPPVDFYQLNIKYNTLVVEDDPHTIDKLVATTKDTSLFNPAVIISRGLNPKDPQTKTIVQREGSEEADFTRWLFDITRESFGTLLLSDLKAFENELGKLFKTITFEEDGRYFFNELYDQSAVRSSVRRSFQMKRALETEEEIVPQSADLLLVEKIRPVERHDKLYPPEADVAQILELDKTGKDVAGLQEEIEEAQRQIRELLEKQGKADLFSLMGLNQTKSYSQAVLSKNRSFHYLPYDFRQSKFEMSFLQEVFSLKEFQAQGLEIYYNGERNLTSFQILCYARQKKSWKYVGRYTPDFLILKRQEGTIHKVLIVETKGSGFADQKGFQLRKNFVESDFIKMNNDKFGYCRFDYLYLADNEEMTRNLAKLQTSITDLFKD